MLRTLRTGLTALAVAGLVLGPLNADFRTSSAKADFLPPPPPGGGGGGGGGAGGAAAAYAIIGVATWFAVLNPQKGSDSILANSIHDEWKCRLDGKDRRTRCAEFTKLPRRERERLYKEAGILVS